jgi:hypothetical protein
MADHTDHTAAKTSTGYFGGPRANAGVVFIGASAYSCSTLLRLTLGAHPSIFYAGETNKIQYFGDRSAPLKKRVCRVRGPDCVVWGDLRVESGQDLYGYSRGAPGARSCSTRPRGSSGSNTRSQRFAGRSRFI